jgi:hypothetical protein
MWLIITTSGCDHSRLPWFQGLRLSNNSPYRSAAGMHRSHLLGRHAADLASRIGCHFDDAQCCTTLQWLQPKRAPNARLKITFMNNSDGIIRSA